MLLGCATSPLANLIHPMWHICKCCKKCRVDFAIIRMSNNNINRIISVILFRGNASCSRRTRPNYENIVFMNNRLLIFLMALFCKIDPIAIFHIHFANIQRAKCWNTFIRIILRWLNYHSYAYICHITNSAIRLFIKLSFIPKHLDKLGFNYLILKNH